MTENFAARISTVFASLMLLTFGALLYFGPDLTDAEHPAALVVALKIAWIGVIAVALLAPFEAFNTYIVVTGEGLRKRNMFFRQTVVRWNEIRWMELSKNGSSIIFKTENNRTLKISLQYNGWDDVQDYARKSWGDVEATRLTNLISRAA